MITSPRKGSTFHGHRVQNLKQKNNRTLVLLYFILRLRGKMPQKQAQNLPQGIPHRIILYNPSNEHDSTTIMNTKTAGR